MKINKFEFIIVDKLYEISKDVTCFVFPGFNTKPTIVYPLPIGTLLMYRSYVKFGTYTGKNPLLVNPNVKLKLIPSISSNADCSQFPVNTFKPMFKSVDHEKDVQSIL